MNTSKIILLIAALLIGFGLIKPKLNTPNNGPVEIVVDILDPPSDPDMKEKALLVVESLKAGSSDRSVDGKRLAGLYFDLATLIELDGEQTVVKNTEDVRQANALGGPMLRMNIKDKYPDLAKNCNAVIVAAIGDDNIPLTKELRVKAAEGFKALSWATNEGSK
jgi:hypothetical protein